MSTQLALFDAGFIPKSDCPSRSARRLLRYIEAFPSALEQGVVYATHEYLAKKLRRSIRTIIRWFQELVRFGYLERRRRGPRSNEYRFLKKSTVEKSVQKKLSGTIPVTSSSGLSLYESKSMNSPTESNSAAISLAESQIQETELAGKRADRPLIRRLAKLLPTLDHWHRLRAHLREFSRRETVRGWGIIVRLAEQTALKTS